MDIRKVIREEVRKVIIEGISDYRPGYSDSSQIYNKIKDLVGELLSESQKLNKVVLNSKSDKGNRIFKMLKTAKFQHYDMPKGELSSFSYGEDDRKRLVSKLGKEDKKIYRAWLKTPEGEASMKMWDGITQSWNKKFPNSKKNLNESKFIIDKYGDELVVDKSWSGFDFPVPQYKTRVKDCMVHIITDENGISEKSFSQYDAVIKEVGDFFKENENAREMIGEFEKTQARPEYVAEKIYNELFHLGEVSKSLSESKKGRRSKFQKLKDEKIPLTDEERERVMNADAVWHFSPGNKPSPAVWKSKDKKTGKITYVTNTHRAFNTAPTLKGAISRYHKFIKGTA